MNKRTLLPIITLLAAALSLASCGGGGGAAPSAPSGSLSGQVGVPDNFSQKTTGGAARTAAKGLAGATVTAGGATATTDADGSFTFASLPIADNVAVTAASGAVQLKAYANVAAGANSKNINSTTTAAAVIHEKMLSLNMPPPAISEIENSSLIAPLTAEIETALLSPQTYNYSTFAGGANASGAITRLNSGASFSDTTAPTITITSPANGSVVLDSDFVDPAFTVSFTYADAESVPDTVGAPVTATLQLSGGSAESIASYFATPTAALQFTRQSASLAALTGSLIDVTTNVTTRAATITISVTDLSGNTGAASATFTIAPDVGPAPQ